MASVEFTWNQAKARANLKKHRVSFEEARSVFFDDEARLLDDPDHSEDEDRFILLGMSTGPRLLVVVHAYRERGGLIRIIPARKATPRERRAYTESRR
ncbi:MAG TPA: BrnT family toxin [Vicinamibacterales bacterium]|jgi:hypothetical protein